MNVQFAKDIYINFVDFFLPLRGQVNAHGGLAEVDYASYNENLVISMECLRKNLLESGKFMDYIAEQDFARCNDFTDVMNFHPQSVDLIDEKVVMMVKSYLGKHVRLDSALLTVMNMNQCKQRSDNNSGFLHHDSVGHRLKLFFPINTHGNSEYPTVYVDNSHNIKWKTYLNSLNAHGNRIDQDLVETYSPTTKYEKIVPFGCGYLFDTNGIHAGSYNPSLEPRMMIQFEFSSTKSSYPGQIGPNHFTFSKYAYARLKKYNLIRPNRLSLDINGVYTHKGRDRREKILNISSFL